MDSPEYTIKFKISGQEIYIEGYASDDWIPELRRPNAQTVKRGKVGFL